jgi:hypothetical protein
MKAGRQSSDKKDIRPQTCPFSRAGAEEGVRRHIAVRACFMAFCALILYLFRQSIFSGLPLWGPDNPPLYFPDLRTFTLASFTGQWYDTMLGAVRAVIPFHPFRAAALLLPARAYHLFGYLAGVALLGLSVAYFLKGRKLRGLSVWLPALSFSFFGYLFTLVGAGHRGLFEGVPFAILVFGLLDRAISRSSLFHFAAAGVCAAWSLAQIDVSALFLILATFYGLARIATTWSRRDTPRRPARMALGILIGTLFFLGSAAMSVHNFFDNQIRGRQEQIETGDGDPWIFATNWSLPPEDTLEFVVPLIFGIDSGHPQTPYWGRLGRSHQWEKSHNGLMNLRQHTVYMGVVQVVFAIFGLFSAVIALRANRRTERDAHAATFSSAGLPALELFLWFAVAILSWLLAMGRYTPLYRLFYTLPYASLMRAPVKFLHLTGFALCVLFAAGLRAFETHFSADNPRAKAVPNKASKRAAEAHPFRLFSYACLFLGVVAILVALCLPRFAEPLAQRWTTLFSGMLPPAYLPRLHDQLLARMRQAFTHSGTLFLMLAGIFRFAGSGKIDTKRATAICLALVALVALDTARVAQPFVRVGDDSMFTAPNPVAKAIKREPGHFRSSYLLPSVPPHHMNWPRRNLEHYHGVNTLEPWPNGQPTPEYMKFYQAFRSNPLRLYQLTSVRHILAPRQMLSQLKNHPAFEVWMYFALSGSSFVPADPERAPYAVVFFKGALPRTAVFHSWTGEPDAMRALQRLTDPAWNPGKGVVVSSPVDGVTSDHPPTPATIRSYRRNRIVIETETRQDGILLLNDHFDRHWKATVNGESAPVLRCNYIMRGVRLRPGRHRIVFSYQPYQSVFRLSLVAPFLLLAWATVRGLRRRCCGGVLSWS